TGVGKQEQPAQVAIIEKDQVPLARLIANRGRLCRRRLGGDLQVSRGLAGGQHRLRRETRSQQEQDNTRTHGDPLCRLSRWTSNTSIISLKGEITRDEGDLAEVLDARAHYFEPVVEVHPHGVAVRARLEDDVAWVAQGAIHENLDAGPVAQGRNGAGLAVVEVSLDLLLACKPDLAGAEDRLDAIQEHAAAGRQDEFD